MEPAGIGAYSLDSSASDIYSDADVVRSFIPCSFNGISIFNTGHADLFGDLFNRWIDGCVRMNGKAVLLFTPLVRWLNLPTEAAVGLVFSMIRKDGIILSNEGHQVLFC